MSGHLPPSGLSPLTPSDAKVDQTASALAGDDVGGTEATAPPAPPNAAEPLPIDLQGPAETDFNDGDSAFSGEDGLSSTASLTSSILNYQYENGRRYHAFRQGRYLLPNDEREQDRLDLEHHIFRLILGGDLFRAPIAKNPQRVLDVGTGTGIWAIEFADEYPSAAILGNDLSPIQPHWIPPNCKFEVDDLESQWIYKPYEKFDFIHGRAICGSIKDWPRFYQQVYENLQPGGWVEMQEYDGHLQSDDDPELLNAPTIAKWQDQVNDATASVGMKLDVAGAQKQYMIDAGFVDVQDDIFKVPSGRWSEDKKLRALGAYVQVHLVECVEPFTLAIFKRILQWDDDEVEVLMAKLKNEFRDRRNKIWNHYHFVYGRKPL